MWLLCSVCTDCVFVYKHTHKHTYKHTCAHIRVHTYTHAHTQTHTQTHTYTHAHKHTHTNTHAHTHIHTHTHTHWLFLARSLSLSLSLSISLSLWNCRLGMICSYNELRSLSFPLSLSFSLSISVSPFSLSLPLPLSLTHTLSISFSLSRCHSFWLTRSSSVSLSQSLALAFPLSLSPFLSIFLYLSFSLPLLPLSLVSLSPFVSKPKANKMNVNISILVFRKRIYAREHLWGNTCRIIYQHSELFVHWLYAYEFWEHVRPPMKKKRICAYATWLVLRLYKLNQFVACRNVVCCTFKGGSYGAWKNNALLIIYMNYSYSSVCINIYIVIYGDTSHWCILGCNNGSGGGNFSWNPPIPLIHPNVYPYCDVW